MLDHPVAFASCFGQEVSITLSDDSSGRLPPQEARTSASISMPSACGRLSADASSVTWPNGGSPQP
jgi:hypothetical protein